MGNTASHPKPNSQINKALGHAIGTNAIGTNAMGNPAMAAMAINQHHQSGIGNALGSSNINALGNIPTLSELEMETKIAQSLKNKIDNRLNNNNLSEENLAEMAQMLEPNRPGYGNALHNLSEEQMARLVKKDDGYGNALHNLSEEQMARLVKNDASEDASEDEFDDASEDEFDDAYAAGIAAGRHEAASNGAKIGKVVHHKTKDDENEILPILAGGASSFMLLIAVILATRR